MLAAQHAPIGARICTARAIRTTGRKFRNRRRIDQVRLFRKYQLIMQEVLSRDRVPGIRGLRAMMDLARSKVPPVDAKEITRRCRCLRGPPFSSSSGRHALPRRRFWAAEWRNSDHFADCSKFEQSLLKMMTRRKRWSTSAGSGWPQGSSLVVQVSGGALARTSSVAPSIKIKSNFSGK